MRLAMLNELANQYWTHPHLHFRSPHYDSATPARLGTPSARAFERLKGLMHFAQLDALLRRETGGCLSLDECVRQLVQRRRAYEMGLDKWIGLVGLLHPGPATRVPWYSSLCRDLVRNEAPVELPVDGWLVSHRLWLEHHEDARRELGVDELALFEGGVVQGCARRQWPDQQMQLLKPPPGKKLTTKDAAYNERARAANADTWEHPPFAAGLRDGDRPFRREGGWDWWGDADMLRLFVRRGTGADEVLKRVAWRPRGRATADCWHWTPVDETHPQYRELVATKTAARGNGTRQQQPREPTPGPSGAPSSSRPKPGPSGAPSGARP